MPPLEYLVAGLAILYCFMILVSVSEDNVALGEPNLKSTEFQSVMIVDGLSRPTGLTFLGPDDILVIEEDTREVKRVIDGKISNSVRAGCFDG